MSFGTLCGLAAVVFATIGMVVVSWAIDQVSVAAAVAGIGALVLAALAVLRALRDA
jgi:hypothetical protein